MTPTHEGRALGRRIKLLKGDRRLNASKTSYADQADTGLTSEVRFDPMTKLHPTDLAEVITTLYLQLNGFFTSGLVLHSEVWGQDIGDVDCLAVWNPFHDQSEREVAPDPFLEMGGRRELLLCV